MTDKDIDNLIAFLSDPTKANIPPDVMARLSAPAVPVKGPNGIARYWTGYGYMNSTEGFAAIGPPWSTITAYDLNKGVIKWQIPMGGVTELEAKGIKGTGSYWPRGGAVVTAGGLILVGTKSDAKLHAYDKDTGKLIWETVIPAEPEGIPAVYEVDGREYVAISARSARELIGAEGGPTSAKNIPNQPNATGYYDHHAPPVVMEGHLLTH